MTLIIVLEAYKRAIKAGLIEADRPLISYCTNTKSESIIMNMFSSFAGKKLVMYAKESGINLNYQQISPQLSDEFFIRWASASKLIPSPLRAGDCSVILKVGPAEKHLAKVLSKLPNKFKSVHIALGSRNKESSRRSENMNKMQLSNKIVKIERSGIAKNLFQVAPIAELTNDDVFELLALIGAHPISKWTIDVNIESYMSNFGLLLELYGNGSNDVCELVIGKTQSSSCSGTARFGCFTCTMSKYENSGIETAKYPRYSLLGAEKALRLRDWLFRIGNTNNKNRAFHAKAYDEVGLNRILLQPNILKSHFLEKIIWYASQLTADSIKAAKDFAEHVENNTLEQHEGYSDILNDPNIAQATKNEFLDMYVSEAQIPQFNVFSERHAILLSAKWAIDGITALPYRPLKIWKMVTEQGKSLSWPKTHNEIEALGGRIELDRTLPNPVALKTMHENTNTNMDFINMNTPLIEYFSLPQHFLGGLVEQDMNCSIKSTSKESIDLNASYQAYLSIDDRKEGEIIGSIRLDSRSVYIRLNNIQISNVTSPQSNLSMKLKDNIKAELINIAHSNLIDHFEHFDDKTRHMLDVEVMELLNKEVHAINSNAGKASVSIPYLKPIKVGQVARTSPIKVSRIKEASPRVILKKKNGIIFGNSRVRSYPLNLEPILKDRSILDIKVLKPHFESTLESTLINYQATINNTTDDILNVLNIDVDNELFSLWKWNGGMERALRQHDHYLEFWMNSRSESPAYRFRKFNGYQVITDLFGEGGLQVKSTYKKVFIEHLKRTWLFNEIGAYDFANSKISDLNSHPDVVDMKTHRDDKAKILINVRKIRNEKRKKYKPMMDGVGRINSVAQAVKDFIEMNLDYSRMHILCGFDARANCVFFDNPATLSQRESTYRTWLLMYQDKFVDIDTLIECLIGRKIAKEIKESKEYPRLMKVVKSLKFSRKLLESVEIKKHYEAAIEDLSKFNEKLTAIGHSKADLEVLKSQYSALMIKYHIDPEKYFNFNTENRQNKQNLAHRVISIIDHLKLSTEMANVAEMNVSKLLEQSGKYGVKSMSLEDKLLAVS
ncbi:hypothetical protein AB4171_13535 [Vibrio sp. 10N.286.51.A4]|uniref:hypothetical protein n=2 Tax=unclassified Vibrio TaxID=2614977 RepID=UPI00354BBE6F